MSEREVAVDRVGDFFREKTVRRATAVGIFLFALWLFRPLLLMLVFFVAFERALGFLSDALTRRAKLGPRAAVVVSALSVVALALGALGFGAERVAKAIVHARDGFPERLAAIRASPIFSSVREHIPDAEHLTKNLEQHAQDAMHVAAALGHTLAYATIGLILAVVFLLERHQIDEFRRTLHPHSLVGTLVRWFEHTSEAIAVTLQLQLIVAVFNTVTTLPVLLALGIPHVVPLMILVFVAALVPVVGNFVSGAILSLLAFQSKGVWGVAVFLTLTFVLHKIEAYYLNPRLTSRHVRLPGFVLILSLLAFEHLFGFAGLFLSFPFLFVAGRVIAEWRASDAEESHPHAQTPQAEGDG